MRAMCEKVIPSNNSSWRYCKYSLDYIPFNWHYHPEFEICLTLNSQGVCHIGDYIAPYDDLDLVILGPDLPHTWQSSPNSDNSVQIVHVAQIPKKWLSQHVSNHPELAVLEALLIASQRGLKFSRQTAVIAKQYFEKIEASEPFEQYLGLLALLREMSKEHSARMLSSSTFSVSTHTHQAHDKFDKVIDYIYRHYTETLCAEQLAIMAHMSTNHFHRFFKKRMERTLTEFINQLRIGHACKELINTNRSITAISDQCGFKNISNFNRRFLMLKGATPSEYRKRLRQKSLV
ncbi:AraC family transcriptional regulator [Pseudoalteromonas porphyrae]|uniref:AraC family transcriptional regulator n=2 Tax=Pseudoalteromonas TaxID=53246 RepID=A0A0N0M078_9GAMM|nr:MULTISPECIES: AraC family transcriptional regulator [Pseudoalteromonas]KPH63751.1 AraC family transcriptional regulator [Pseudoalteromonas porphyrae]KPH94153.1 AraC family transcriptional regulator [Pseudoalteromonas porphyrae]NNG41907.1 helix-turn-helix domain-containing protein [Pseudoalteromonas sp. NEC-BIFX-2020_002]